MSDILDRNIDPRENLDPASLDAVFTRHPKTWSDNELRNVLETYAKTFAAWDNEQADAKKSGRKVQSKAAAKNAKKIKLDDLDLDIDLDSLDLSDV